MFNSCSVVIQNTNHPSAILSPGYINFVEVLATNIKQPHYKVNDFNSSIHTIVHTNYPDLSEPKHPVRRSCLKRSKVEIKTLQPSQILNRPLPFLTYSPDVQQLLKKIKFQYSDVTDDKIQNSAPIWINMNIVMLRIVMMLVK